MNVFKKCKLIFGRRKAKRLGLNFPLYCKAHGVSSAERQGGLAQSREDDELLFVHTPLPDYPNNVYVYSISLNRILGYLRKELSEKLVKAFGKGFCLDGEIFEVTGGTKEKPIFGANLCIRNTANNVEKVMNLEQYGEE